MRLNRKWLYSGGLVAILTLLLTLTWVLPAGAVGTLDEGNVDTDVDYVSPDLDLDRENATDPHPRAVTVTLSNSDLDTSKTVGVDNDLGGVRIQLGADASSARFDSLRLLLNTTEAQGAEVPGNPTVTYLKDGETAASLLPITGELAIQVGPDATDKALASDLGAPRIINAVNGLIEIPLLDDLSSGAEIFLSYTTSPQETALVNVIGDLGNFDLLTIEDPAGPAGEYEGSVIVASEVLIDIGTGDDAGLVHEQHAVPSGLEGYVESREEIRKRYRTYDNAEGLSGLFTDDPTTTTDDEGQVDSSEAFYIKVSNPPIRMEDGSLPGSTAVSAVESRRTSRYTITSIPNAAKGIVQLTVESGETLRESDDVVVSYIGSDSFYVQVNHWPIQGLQEIGGATHVENVGALVPTDNTERDTMLNRLVVVPARDFDDLDDPDDDTPTDTILNASDVFELIDIVDHPDGDCYDCRLWLGVVTGPGGEDDDEPLGLYERISVLGVTYQGSQRGAVAQSLAPSVEDNLGTADVDETRNVTFSVPLDFTPADGPDEDPVGTTEMGKILNDIEVVGVSSRLNQTDSNFPMPVRVVGSVVTLQLAVGDNLVFSNDVDPTTEGDQAADATTRTMAGDTIDIAYIYKAGANPQNALVPNGSPRPMVAVTENSRVTFLSDNDRATVDAEAVPPSFSNPDPGMGSATPDEDQVISVDITDGLAGVDEDSVIVYVREGRTAPFEEITKDNNRDLDFVDIDGGIRVSISLDDIDDLEIDADETPIVQWYVTASDNASNMDSSDASDDEGQQHYSFTVDGEATELDRAYTGDWFNTAKKRVDGDRRLGVEQYLPGSAKNTSIRVVFQDPIDGDSVATSDFTVNGDEPLSARWYGKGDTNPFEDPDTDPISRSVFLGVPAMPADDTPEVKLVGSISDRAGNESTSGTVSALDGIAPSPVVTVDKALSDERVTITVTTDERIRTLAPSLSLYVSDAIEEGVSGLDESDTFTVDCQDPADNDADENGNSMPDREEEAKQGMPPASGKCVLALRNSDGDEIASGSALDLASDTNANDDVQEAGTELTLSTAPILDGDGDGNLEVDDVDVAITSTLVSDEDGVVLSSTPADYDADAGTVVMKVRARTTGTETHGLLWGDEITVTYHGTDADPAMNLDGVPNPTGRQVSSTSWTFELDVTRPDKFAAVATVEDAARNEGVGGEDDPRADGATVFEIDNQLAGGIAATPDPRHDPAGNLNEPTISDPFFIEISWKGEKDEYPR